MATVDGPGSIWRNSGELNMSDYGSSSTLNVRNGGMVTATHLKMNDNSLVNIGGEASGLLAGAGMLDIPLIQGVGSITPAVLQFNHSAPGSQPYYFTLDGTSATDGIVMQGILQVEHNAGHTVFTADSSSSGGFNIRGGTVYAAHANALGGITNDIFVHGRGALELGAPGGDPLTLNVKDLFFGTNSATYFDLGSTSDQIQAVNFFADYASHVLLRAGDGFGVGTYILVEADSLTGDAPITRSQIAGYVISNPYFTPNTLQVDVTQNGLNFWDGNGPGDNNIVEGGSGIWNASDTNWTDASGSANNSWPVDGIAVFGGQSGGTVTLVGAQSVAGIHFTRNGYLLTGDDISISGGSPFVVAEGVTATIASNITASGSASFQKYDLGTLVLTGDSTFSSSNVAFGTLIVDGGSITQSGSVNLAENPGGHGTLEIINGGSVSGSYAYLSYGEASYGVATVRGPGSIWTSSDTFYVGYTGHGELNILDQGVVRGTDDATIGSSDGAVGIATIDGGGSLWESSSTLTVGFSGHGLLDILNGGAVSNHNGRIARSGSSSQGMVTVDGENSTWTNTGYLRVGEEGHGTLNILNGGTVSNTIGYISYDPDSAGFVTVNGLGSSWINTGSLFIGYEDQGILSLLNEGKASATEVTLNHNSIINLGS
ncbi:MAG TPA: hypothetical protein VK968_06785, partial [Roseimicrobium sp.]|nr:hypothetical protein [Roseimicrobium sp.]